MPATLASARRGMYWKKRTHDFEDNMRLTTQGLVSSFNTVIWQFIGR